MRSTERSARSTAQRFYRQPLVWLGAVIFAASLAGCIAMIILAARHPDEALPVESERLLKVPVSQAAGDWRPAAVS